MAQGRQTAGKGQTRVRLKVRIWGRSGTFLILELFGIGFVVIPSPTFDGIPDGAASLRLLIDLHLVGGIGLVRDVCDHLVEEGAGSELTCRRLAILSGFV